MFECWGWCIILKQNAVLNIFIFFIHCWFYWKIVKIHILLSSPVSLEMKNCHRLNFNVYNLQDRGVLFVGTFPRFRRYNVGTPIIYNFFCFDFDFIAKMNNHLLHTFLVSLTQYVVLSACLPACPFQLAYVCVRSLGNIVGASPPLWKYVCPFVGLHCGCVPPSVCPFNW